MGRENAHERTPPRRYNPTLSPMTSTFATDAAVAGTAGLLASLALTPAVRALARRAGVVAKDQSDRWHTRPTAMLGGVAIAIAVVVAVLFLVPRTRESVIVLAASSALFVIGLTDDFLRIRPSQKLIGQLLVAGVARRERHRHALLARRHHERREHARQHGRAGRRRLCDRGGVSGHEFLRRRAVAAVHDADRVRRRAGRIPRLQPPPRLHLHGRLRLDVRRLLPRLERARRGAGRRAVAQRRSRAGGAGARAGSADFRYDAGDAAAEAGRPAGLAGGPRSHLAPARRPRTLRAKRGVDALRVRRRRRRAVDGGPPCAAGDQRGGHRRVHASADDSRRLPEPSVSGARTARK